MASGETPRPSLDRAIGALRLMLISAQDDEAARNQVLPALSRCTMLVPTWPNAQDQVRMITSPSGEVSMPLFTGRDALEHAAKRFHWQGGATSFRSVDAREALNSAAEEGVKYVVLDVGAEHALELPRHEILTYLERGTGTFREPRATPNPRSTMTERELAQTEPVEVPRPSRAEGRAIPREDPRRDDARAHIRSTMEQRIEAMMAEEAAAEASARAASPVPAAPPRAEPAAPARAEPAAPARKKRGLAEIDDPFASVATRRPASTPTPKTGGTARRVPSGAAAPLARHMPSQPFQSQLPPRPDSKPNPQAVELKDAAHAAGVEPPRPAVAQQVTEVAPIIEAAFVRADDDYDFGGGAGAGAAHEPVPYVAPAAKPRPAPAPLPDVRPSASRTEPEHASIPPLAQTSHEAAPGPAPPTLSDVPAPIETERASSPVERAVEHVAAKEAPVQPSPAAAAAPAPARERPITAEALQAPFESIDDTVLSAIADELRKYPEVEWACELATVEPGLILGVRIEPSYLTRAAEIEAKVEKTARERGVSVLVLRLSEMQLMKSARSVGRMFFPWKKKK